MRITELFQFSTLFIIIIFFISCAEPTIDSRNYIEDTASLQLMQLIDPAHSNLDFNNIITENEQFNLVSFEGYSYGAGIAVLDYNNDGLQDIYFAANMGGDKLYKNLGDLKFEDVTLSAGILNKNWSTGVAVVDINNDGYDDVYVCKFLYDDVNRRPNLFYINNGDGTFSESAQSMGVNDNGYSIMANFFDYDKDGDLDLYVANQPPNSLVGKQLIKGKVDYAFTDRLYRNDGQRFTDVTQESGITNYCYSLSTTTLDYNNDGWVDLYVASDFEEPDMLYRNNANGTFTNVSDEALKHMGNFSMGTDIADINNDGLLDIFTVDMVAEDNYRQKTNMSGMNPEKFYSLVNNGYHYQYMFNSLQLNNGDDTFSEIAQLSGVSNTDWSWAPLFMDIDQDGFKDLIVTNGLYKDIRNKDFEKWRKEYLKEELKEIKTVSMENIGKTLLDISNNAKGVKVSNYIYKNNRDLSFTKLNNQWGFDTKTWSNGAAYADFDNDGDLDLVINNMNMPAHLYRNQSNEEKLNNYLMVELVADGNNISGINAKVEIKLNDKTQVVEYTPYRGYMSCSQRIAQFGLGKVDLIDEVKVSWIDGSVTTLKDVKANQIIQVKKSESKKVNAQNKKLNPIFSTTNMVDVSHIENPYDDYKREILLPYKTSTLGPVLAKGDVNNDGMEDIYLGGSATNVGQLLLSGNNNMTKVNTAIFQADKMYEDGGAEFIDYDNDGDLDLYVASGGNEYALRTTAYNDRLYINDGNGNFKQKTIISSVIESTSTITPLDYDGDGDLDLFIGGRQIPGNYGRKPNSYLLENNNGKYIDVTSTKAPILASLGMVTDSKYADINGDGVKELIIAGEWMPILILNVHTSIFQDVTETFNVPKVNGWWNTIEIADYDMDGDQDIIAGNLGHNIKYKASASEPFKLYVDDFDKNGTNDVYLAYYQDGQSYPVRGRQCSSEQMPFVKDKFKTYDQFGLATVDKILDEHISANTEVMEVHSFSNSIFRNDGNKFTQIVLPNEAQLSPVYGIAVDDFDKDGRTDIFLAGNMYNREVETTRSDAGKGCLITYIDNDIVVKNSMQTGVDAHNDVRDVEIVKAKGKSYLLIANNNSAMQVYEY